MCLQGLYQLGKVGVFNNLKGREKSFQSQKFMSKVEKPQKIMNEDDKIPKLREFAEKVGIIFGIALIGNCH